MEHAEGTRLCGKPLQRTRAFGLAFGHAKGTRLVGELCGVIHHNSSKGSNAPWRTPLPSVTPMRHSHPDSERQRDQVQLEQLLAPVLPPLIQEETTMLTCRVPAQPHQALKAWCQSQGIPLSDYVRSRLYDQPLPQRQPKRFVSPLDRGVLVELNRLGNNLNQTVRRLNRQDNPGLSDSDRQLLQALQTQLQDIRAQLAAS